MEMTLIWAVRKARDEGMNYIAVDRDERIYGFVPKPETDGEEWYNSSLQDDSGYMRLGGLKLTCDWKDALIKLDDIKVK